MRSFTAGKNEDGLRLWRFCEKMCPLMPKGLLHKAFRNKRVKINGRKRREDYRLVPGDKIELYINDEFFPEENSASRPRENRDFSALDIVYEDDNILIANKPFGLLCHSDSKNQPNLIDMITAYLQNKGEYNPREENTFAPALCNRIDQGTGGMVIAAKNRAALVDINRVIKAGKAEKTYLCVTENPVARGRYTAYLKRDTTAKKVTVSSSPAAEAKEIVTEFKTLESRNGYSLVECHLITGRTHQIRAHLAFLGCAILGDKKYGKPFKGLDSQMLCACKLKFKDIDPSMSVSYLSNREFCLKNNPVKEFFNRL